MSGLYLFLACLQYKDGKFYFFFFLIVVVQQAGMGRSFKIASSYLNQFVCFTNDLGNWRTLVSTLIRHWWRFSCDLQSLYTPIGKAGWKNITQVTKNTLTEACFLLHRKYIRINECQLRGLTEQFVILAYVTQLLFLVDLSFKIMGISRWNVCEVTVLYNQC